MNDIHTCHENCDRPECVAARESQLLDFGPLPEPWGWHAGDGTQAHPADRVQQWPDHNRERMKHAVYTETHMRAQYAAGLAAGRAERDAEVERLAGEQDDMVAELHQRAPLVDAGGDMLPAMDLLRAVLAEVERLRADERYLRRLLAARSGIPGIYYDDGEAQGTEHGVFIDFMRHPVAEIDAKLRAINVARLRVAEPPSAAGETNER